MKRRPNTQSLQWFVDRNAVGELNLDPPFQRRSVWSLDYQRYFIDTILRGYLVDSVSVWLEQAGVALDEIEVALDSQRGQALIAEGVTAVQVVQVLAADDVGPEALVADERRVLVTNELVAVAPDFGLLPEETKVQL